ncbi:uvrabc system c [Gossypium arboreum]|uniref:Uvrabc system c n=1 Tax=Gossypium arboreum TaxID=29729 RepID=A0A0B0PFZ3_GOSAR|nr:uvrabc system c [Gossypium arboreum]
MRRDFTRKFLIERFLFLNPSSQVVLHSSTVDGGRGSIERAFQPLIKPRLKAKPSRPGRSRSGGFPLEFEPDDGGRSFGDAIRDEGSRASGVVCADGGTWGAALERKLGLGFA